MTIIAVSTAQELTEALESANGGDRIELAAGDYGDFYFQKKAFDERITITSADPDDVATFNTFYLNFVENITVENVFIDYHPTVDTKDFESALQVNNSAHVKIDSVVLEGKLIEHSPDGAGSDPVMLPTARAATFYNSEDITFSNNEASVFRSGVNLNYVEGLTFSGNDIHDVRSSAIGGAVLKDVVLTDNHFHNFVPYGNPSTTGDHSGFVHFWTVDGQPTPNQNFYIADNFFEVGGEGINENVSATLGINFDDNARGIGVENVLVENNVFHMSATMGVGVENGVGVIIRDNTLLQSGGDDRQAPGIMITGEIFDNWTIEGNILTEIEGVAIYSRTYDIEDLDINISDNLLVQRFNPEADNYVGNLFVNPLTSDGDLEDFMVIPGSDAVGVGAQLLQTDGQASLIAIDADTKGGFETLSVSVSVADLLGGLSDAQINAMSIVWDFGDGTTATGNDLIHTYAQTGAYKITGVATASDGTQFSLNKVVEVKTPNGIDVRFDTGVVDLSDTLNDATVTGNAVLVNTAGGKALDLQDENARVKFDVNDELSNNPNFTLSFDFKYDDDSQSGFAIYFPGTAIMRLDNGELQLIGKTSLDENVSIQTSNLKLDDSNWHRASYVLSQATGTATLYIDGSMVGNIFGLEGIQPPAQSHGLTIGSPFGQSFSGQVDNISFLRAALSEDDIDLFHGDTAISLSDLVGIPDPEVPTDTNATDVSLPQNTSPAEPAQPAQDTSSSQGEQGTQEQAITSPTQPTSTAQPSDDTDPSEPANALAPVNQNIDTASIARLNPGIAEDVLQEIAMQFASFTTSDEHHSSGGWLEWASADGGDTATGQPVDAVGIHLFGNSATSSTRQNSAAEDVEGEGLDQFLVTDDSFDFFQ